MSVFALGLNHATAPVTVRSRFAMTAEQIGPALTSFRQRLQRAAELAVVSTCNRTELYLGADRELLGPALQWLAERGQTDAKALREHLYVLEDGSAARHVFRVASGLDSMVLGEPQILGQLKTAARTASSAGTLGTTLHQLFQRSFAVAKAVRSRTEIGAHSVSLAAAAVRLAERLFEDLGQTRVLCIGAGEMTALAAAHFAARRPLSLTVANRSPERAAALAARWGGNTLALAELAERLGDFDIVVSCTASSLPIVGLGAMQRALKARRRRPMCLVDLAMPRDIEAEVAQLPDAYLYTLDDVGALVRSGQHQRQAAVQLAEAIVETGVEGFLQWVGERGTVPLIREVQGQAERWRTDELARARRRLANGEDPDAVLQRLSQALTQKLMHGTMVELRGADEARRVELAGLFLRR